MSRRYAWAIAIVCGVFLTVLVGSWSGIFIGIILSVVLGIALGRVESRYVRRERIQLSRQLPIVVDLLAAALRAGAPPDHAALIVGEAVGYPLGHRLVQVAHGLRIGLSPEIAWGRLLDIPGAEGIVRSAIRSAESGAAFTTALDKIASDLRTSRMVTADAMVRRMSVLGVLPLGLCFLPAFILTGVVPIVIAIFEEINIP